VSPASRAATRLLTRRGGPLKGSVRVPGDKSITHRAIILGGMAEGVTTVRGYLAGEDCLATLAAFRRMGVRAEAGEELTIESPGWAALAEPDDVIDCGNSGTTARLLTGLLAGLPWFSVLTGDASLRRRPMGRVTEPLARMGAEFRGRDGGTRLPLAISGRRLTGMAHTTPVASAQIKSALLLAGLTARGETAVTEPALSRDHTERMAGAFGVPLRRDGLTVAVTGGGALRAARVEVPADLSSAAFLAVAACLVPGSEVVLEGVGVNPTRTGVLEVLAAMGADIERRDERLLGDEPVADLVVRHAPLRGVEIGPELVPRTIDELPVLFAAAAGASGTTTVRGAQELRVKESDRIAAMARELGRVGVRVEELPDGLVVHGPASLQGTACEAYGDHRMAMSMAVLGLVAEGEMAVDAAPIATSFPGFAAALHSLGARITER
jgi:3-phosphoshikimate 1-carboxyvinyltransferase